MTNESQLIAIAELCGWKFTEKVTDTKSGRSWNVYEKDGKRGSVMTNSLPDYLNDLNAMHEAAEILTEEQLKQMCGYLMTQSPWRAMHATAAQRAEALLRALNLWTD